MATRVLVPMDDSDHAEKALKYAFKTFPEVDITVLHVVGVPSMMMGEATALALDDDLEQAASDHAEPVLERAQQLAAEHDRELTTIVGVGHPAKNILKRAENYDTIVLGAHGAGWQRATHRYLVGNITETVSKRAPVPVVIVR